MPTRVNLSAKDFELIAAVIADSVLSDDDKWDLSLAFADRLLATSDSFDPVRFVSDAADTLVDADEIAACSTALRYRVEAQAARRSPR